MTRDRSAVPGWSYRITRGPMRGRFLEVERVTEFHVVAHYSGDVNPFTVSRLWFGTHTTRAALPVSRFT